MRTLAILIVLSSLAAPARAEDDAKELYKKASAHFNLGRFKEAAAEYERVFELHPDAVILYNIAQSYRLAGDNDEKALFFYRSYLQRAPKAPNRAEVVERIAALEKMIEERKKTQQKPPNTTLPGDGDKKPAATEKPAEPPPPPVVAQKPVDQPTPVYKKWWLWTIVGGVVVAGVAVGLGIGLTQSPSFNPNLPEGGPSSMGLRF